MIKSYFLFVILFVGILSSSCSSRFHNSENVFDKKRMRFSKVENTNTYQRDSKQIDRNEIYTAEIASNEEVSDNYQIAAEPILETNKVVIEEINSAIEVAFVSPPLEPRDTIRKNKPFFRNPFRDDKTQNKLATISLTLGIFSLFYLPIIGSILGIAFGLFAIRRADAYGVGGRKMAIIGIIISLVGLLFFTGLAVFLLFVSFI